VSSVEPVLSAALTEAQLGTLPLDQLIAEAEILSIAGRAHDALELYRVWLASTPSPMAYAVWFNVGVMSASMNDSRAAEEAYRNAIAQHPEFIPARLNLGTVLERLGRTDEALENWAKILELGAPVLALSPEYHTQTLNNLGRLLEILKRYDEAESRLAESLAVVPDQPDVRQHWIHLRQKQCKWPVNSGPFAMSGSAFMSSGSALSTLSLSDSFEVQLNAARRFVDKKVRKATEFLAAQEGYNHERLRIGYVSSDFCLHPVSLLTVEVFEKHDREKFEVFGFCHSPEDGSEIRKRVMSAFDHFHVIKNMSDEAAARLIRSLEIDILIDLQGLTSGVRPDIFTYRPARVQVTWLGFPGTTGQPEIDYVLSDASVIPLGSEHGYTEKPLRLPFCFQPSDNMRVIGQTPTRAECGLPEDAFVFCCFNNNYKFTPEIFTSWMRILARTPGSVLWLLADNQWSKANLLLEAERHGIDTHRLIFAGRVAPPDYLARYQMADLFLDTFPFNAGTTANDALWMGLPVLTLAGESFASRMAASLLDALGQPDFITHSIAHYEDLAVEWAQNRDELSTRRQALLAARTVSRLYDMALFVTDLEGALTSTISNPAADPVVKRPVQKKTFLQFNPGGSAASETLPLFKTAAWRMTEGGDIPHIGNYRGKTVNAIFLNQYLPCCFAHDVQKTLQRCLATLDDDGFLIATCPDLVTIAQHILSHGLTKPSYISEAGPITPLDMIFGHGQTIHDGQTALAHHTGFTQESLVAHLGEAGFKSVRALTRPEQFEVIAVATKRQTDDHAFTELLRQIFQ
jgi:predicted O-linked N-acetylglucosamine transferase (SPINDLY family)